VPQLNLYVPEQTARLLRQRAKARGVSVSKYLASIILRDESRQWPSGYFRDAVGAWKGELKRPGPLSFEERDSL